jgi:hypothetical protein
MAHLPLPPPSPVPPRRQPDDRHAWREEGTGFGNRFKRPDLSTAQVLVFWVVASAVVAAIVIGLGRLGAEDGPAIVSPRDGARVQPGMVYVRARVPEATTWELSLALPAAADEWRVLAGGPGPLEPLPRAGGMMSFDAREPGTYKLRLVVHDRQGNLQFDKVVRFRVTE